MKNKIKLVLSIGLVGMLSGCETMDGLMSDSGMRDYGDAAVVRPAPRANIQTGSMQTENFEENSAPIAGESSIPSAHTPQTQPAAKTPAQNQPNNSQTAIPNVAPTLGE